MSLTALQVKNAVCPDDRKQIRLTCAMANNPAREVNESFVVARL